MDVTVWLKNQQRFAALRTRKAGLIFCKVGEMQSESSNTISLWMDTADVPQPSPLEDELPDRCLRGRPKSALLGYLPVGIGSF
jgi:hypothetical protein